ncbi:MAG: glycoside hydrolase family 99-like domain-containing protein, partial [Desulfobacteraceae bacterium]
MPRILPFWQSVFAHLKVPVRYVIACRNPMSVARSLAKRDRFDLEKGYFLWLEHTICSLTRTADQNRIVVDYDRLMEDPALQLERMAQCLGVTFDPDGPEFDAFSRLFLEESLRHSRFHPEDVDLEKSAPPSAAALYKVLDGLAGDTVRFEDPEVVSLVDRISALLDENYTALGYMRACEERILSGLHQVAVRDAQIGELTAAVSERDGRIADFQRLVSQRDNQVAELTGAVSERDGRIAEFQQLVSQRDNQVAELTGAVSERDGRIADFQRLVSQHEAQVAELTAAVSERDGRIADFQRLVSESEAQLAELTGAVSQRDGQIGNLKQALEVAHVELNRIYASNSWKLTTPLRFFRRSLITRPYWFFRKMSSDFSRWCWQRLPVPVRAKQKFKNALFGRLPFLFGWSRAYRNWKNFNAPLAASPPDVKGEAAGHPVENTLPHEPLDEFVPRLDAAPLEHKPAKLICFYLPQFHPIPENDAWWGEGFTEWTNVRPARPQFAGHYQPRVPGELGYYDLRDPQVQRRQVVLAKIYGIEGFCFFLYWFGGKRLLEAPVENYLSDKSLDLPFCLCWANENWSRRWDGLDNEILIAQEHSPEDDLAFIRNVARYMQDSRYIRIDGKPLFLVYRPSLLPSARETAARWRDWCRQFGIGEIFLAYTQSFEAVDPGKYGFDAAVEFPPNNSAPPDITESVTPLAADFGCTVYDWKVLVERSAHYKRSGYNLFRGVCPSWDNTPRRKSNATIFLNNSPMLYQRWLANAIRDTQKYRSNLDERLIFVNAWNEWAEGAYLEPDERCGYAYLEATRMALIKNSADHKTAKTTGQDKLAVVIHAFYVDVFEEILAYLKNLDFPVKLFVTTPLGQAGIIKPLIEKCGFEYQLMEVANHGRDVLPFLKIIPDVVGEGFEVFLKLHTKKSKHRQDGAVWLKDILGKLVSPGNAKEIIQTFN